MPTDKDRHYVRSLRAYGLADDEIAHIVGIGEATLQRHYRHELDTAMPLANAKAAERLHHFIEGKVGGPKEWLSATIFRLKTKGRWQTVQRHEHGGTNDAPPIQHENTQKFDWSGLNEQEQELVRALLKSRAAKPE